MDALKVERLGKSFGGLEVLCDVSFALKPGERWAIIGPNGAGKTTLLHILSGVLPASAGTIQLWGNDITHLSTYERLRLGLARSFQINSLFPRLTVQENILLALHGNREMRGQYLQATNRGDARYARMEELLNSIGLLEKKDSLVRELAYGEQRQMEIGMALASEPKVLLLDEPSAGLSAAESAKMVSMLRGVTEGSTLLFAAHDMDVVFTLADRIMVLFFGKIVVQGTCSEIQCNAIVKEIYLGGD